METHTHPLSNEESLALLLGALDDIAISGKIDLESGVITLYKGDKTLEIPRKLWMWGIHKKEEITKQNNEISIEKIIELLK